MIIIEIWLLTMLYFNIIIGFAPVPGFRLQRKEWFTIIIVGMVAGAYIGSMKCLLLTKISIGIFISYLSSVSIMDHMTKEVYDFFHIFGILASFLLLYSNPPMQNQLSSVIFFAIIQFVIFKNMYGMADCLVFCVCGMFLGAMGWGMLWYLYHMGITFFMLLLVQAIRKNINHKGNLIEPVALVPYISVAFCFCFFFLSKHYLLSV